MKSFFIWILIVLSLVVFVTELVLGVATANGFTGDACKIAQNVLYCFFLAAVSGYIAILAIDYSEGEPK